MSHKWIDSVCVGFKNQKEVQQTMNWINNVNIPREFWMTAIGIYIYIYIYNYAFAKIFFFTFFLKTPVYFTDG